MSIFIDAVVRWLLAQPAARRLVNTLVQEEIRAALSYDQSSVRKAMARITRGEAKDAIEDAQERTRSLVELDESYVTWSREQREAAEAARFQPAPVSSPPGPFVAKVAANVDLGKFGPKETGYVSPADPLTGPWDAPPPPRCERCSEPIEWVEKSGPAWPSGGVWTHVVPPRVSNLHVARYALSDVETTAVLPKLDGPS